MKKIFALFLTVLLLIITLSGCQDLEYSFGKINEAMRGRPATIQTYDVDSNIIDSIRGKSISLSADDKFATTDSSGVTKKSEVLSITVGGKVMEHVGSSLLMYEDGLEDVFTEYAKKVNIKNFDRSTPFINRMVNDMQNSFTGKRMVILVRSQNGKPLATFAGNKVSIYSTDSDKTTALLVDKKYLVIYRCDYTIYETGLLEQ